MNVTIEEVAAVVGVFIWLEYRQKLRGFYQAFRAASPRFREILLAVAEARGIFPVEEIARLRASNR